MGAQYKPVKGDRVRVVLEGEVDWFGPKSGNFEIGGHHIDASSSHEHIVSIEKIEPPVEVFKPGDVVRSKGYTGPGYAISKEGYVELASGHYYEDGRAFCEKAFTSTYYERVPLS